MIKKKYFPVPQVVLKIPVLDTFDDIVEKISRFSTDRDTAKKKHYSIHENLFIMELRKDGFVLEPEQSNHYGNHNGVMPVFTGSFVKQDGENNYLKIGARSELLYVGVVFVALCSLLCLFLGKIISGLAVFIISNVLLQIAFWLPCNKVTSELQGICRTVPSRKPG